MRNLNRAQRKKLQRKIKVGDAITWGTGAFSYKTTQVTPQGVWVDISSDEDKSVGVTTKDGRTLLFVAFDGNVRACESRTKSRGPIRKVQLWPSPWRENQLTICQRSDAASVAM